MIDRLVYFVGTLVTLLRISLSQDCPSGCTCSLNGSNDGTIVVCNGYLDNFLVFHLVHPKIISVVIRNYENVESVDLSEHNIADLSDVQIGSGSIKHLDLSYNLLTTASLRHFTSLEMLELINLSNNGMTNFDVSNVVGLSRLTEINLEDNDLRTVVFNPTFFTRLNFPFLTIILYGNPLECLCDSNNALAEFAADQTNCLTGDGLTSTIEEACSSSPMDDTVPTLVGNSSLGHPLNVTTTSRPEHVAITTNPSSTPSLRQTRATPPFLMPSTSPSEDSTKNSHENVFVIIGVAITAVMAFLIILLFTLMIMVCRLKKRFIPHGQNHDAKVTAVSADPENYLSPIRTRASIRGVHYISESVMRLSQISEPQYEEIDPISERLGPPPPLPNVEETSTDEAPRIVPYHVTNIKDLEEPNQYLDVQA